MPDQRTNFKETFGKDRYFPSFKASNLQVIFEKRNISKFFHLPQKEIKLIIGIELSLLKLRYHNTLFRHRNLILIISGIRFLLILMMMGILSSLMWPLLIILLMWPVMMSLLLLPLLMLPALLSKLILQVCIALGWYACLKLLGSVQS